MDSDTLTWRAHEHQPFAHSSDWLWAVGIIGGTAALAAFILNNFFFGVLLLCAAGAIILFARKEPPEHTFLLDSRGLHIDNTLYPTKELLAFSIVQNTILEEDGEESETYLLLIDTPRIMTPDLAIPLQDINPETVYLWFVENEIPEGELRESFALKVLEFFGF